MAIGGGVALPPLLPRQRNFFPQEEEGEEGQLVEREPGPSLSLSFFFPLCSIIPLADWGEGEGESDYDDRVPWVTEDCRTGMGTGKMM